MTIHHDKAAYGRLAPMRESIDDARLLKMAERMNAKYILALDQGTTSTRAIIFNKSGGIVSSAAREFPQIYPHPGWVEHSPEDILGSVVAVIGEALVRAGISASDIAAMGVTNQRETTFVWDKLTGKPVYNAIVWQCRRTAEYCETLKRDNADVIYEKTGLVPDAYFSATKIKWILDNVEGARALANEGRLLFGTVDTFILWRLSRGKIYATDYTNAARTMLFNIHELKWDKELLNLFGVPENMLPEVLPSGRFYGNIDESFFGSAIPVYGVAGDQQSALFGQLCFDEGDVKNTYGTGCFLLMNTKSVAVKSKNGLLTTLAAGLGKPDYALEGSVFVGGALVQWLRDELKILSTAAESEEEALKADNCGGVYVVPAFTGLGAPYWDPDARGAILGVTRGTNRSHIVRAALESIAYEVYDLVDAMQKDAGVKIARLAVDGGASENNFLMQFQSDILNCTVVRPVISETTALGAAYLAGLASGYWDSVDELKRNARTDRVFTPDCTEEKRNERLSGWQKAVRQTRAK